MAETIISAVVGDVVSRMISLILWHFSHQQSTEAKLASIGHMLIRIHSLVEEAKGRQIANTGTLQWLSELIDVEYEGRYLLDTVGSGINDNEQDGHGEVPHVSTMSLFNPAKRVRVAGCTMKRLLFQHYDLNVDEIDRVKERLQDVSSHLREFIMLLQSYQPISRPLATNIFRDGQMFGRHVEKERIINFLLHVNRCSAREVDVLPVVGDSGAGKTTLVQHACNDSRVRNHFAVIMLCCTYTISTNGGTAVLQSKLTIGDVGINLNEPLQLFKGNFCDKRFLMVFEDVDMQKMQMLERLLPSMRCSKEGSKVIITTNSRRAAAIGTGEPLTLNVLPFPEYWFFFKAQAFACRDIEENPKLVAASKAIARKLNGSFYGAKIVGQVLRDHPDPRFWCMILRSNIAGMCLLGDGIAYVWDLADNLLPGHVEVCKMTVSKSPFPYQTTDLATLQDLCRAAPHANKITCWAESMRFEKVLLCKSVFPFHNCYHIARCICTCAAGSPISYPKATVV